MTPSQQRYLLIGLLVAGAVIVLMAVVIALTRSQRDIQVASPAAQAPSSSGGFSFFNVDRTTVLTNALRENLSDTLGSDAIAHATPIDLTVVSPGFLQTHLPQIATLNRGFNPPLGGRREHDTTRLTYHRAESRQMPFRYVELVFSSRNGLPLYFLIEPTADFADSTATLSAKYGSPRQVETEEQRYPVQIWEKDGDVLVASTFERRNGRLSQQLRMYFVDNLRLLLQAEEEARRREDRQTRRAAERAF